MVTSTPPGWGGRARPGTRARHVRLAESLKLLREAIEEVNSVDLDGPCRGTPALGFVRMRGRSRHFKRAQAVANEQLVATAWRGLAPDEAG